MNRGKTYRRLLAGTAGCAILAGMASAASAQQAQEAPEEIVVTGSFIRGTPKDAALPIAVLGQQDLVKQGSPNILDVMKTLPASGGVLGEANQTSNQAQGAGTGVQTVNLRNLGPARTLVLLNGRRMANFPTREGAVDVGTLPLAALDRIEILKDGAAATYGSDAIGGVVNFITRHKFDGLQLTGSVRHVPDADDPDLDLSGIIGWNGDRGNIMLSAGWQTRGRLRPIRRGFNIIEYTENPQGGYSPTNNPTSFRPVIGKTVGAQIRDPGCVTVGAVPAFLTAAGPATCFSRLSGLTTNLVDDQSRFQIYGEVNLDFDDTTSFRAEALFSGFDINGMTSFFPDVLTPPTAADTPEFPGFFYAPAANPGLALLMKQFPGAFPAGTTGVIWGLNQFRAYGLGGHPQYDNGPVPLNAKDRNYRVLAELSGQFSEDVRWNVATTYNRNVSSRTTTDMMVYRAALALRGYGNLASTPNACNATVTSNFTTNAGNNALGCYFLNPFTNAYAKNSVAFQQNTGKANPLFDPSVANPLGLVEWLDGQHRTEATSQLFVVDTVLNGRLPWELSGGRIGWAAGAQFRRSHYETNYGDLANMDITPCVDTPFTGTKNCTPAVGPFFLQSGGYPTKVSQNVWAAFVELDLPVTDKFGAHAAARYEDYGSKGGSTFNPKLDLRWQTLDWLALRGSVGTTFRAPPLPLIDPTPTVATTQLAGAQRAYATRGNADLQSETATTFSVGIILAAGEFRATVDYWNFNFKKPIVVEPVSTIFSQMFPGNSSVNCNNPALAVLQSRFQFDQNGCGAANVTLVNISYVNSGGIKTDGVDVDASYTFRDLVGGGDVNLGTSISYTHKYDVAEQRGTGGALIAPAFSAVGKLNYNIGLFALPRWKGNAYIEWSNGAHNIRIQENYSGPMFDQRAIFTGNLYTGNVTVPSQATVTPVPKAGQNIGAFYTTDITYRVELPRDFSVVLNVSNVFDKDPPFVRNEPNYDATTASALGRTYKFSVTKRF